MNVVRGDSPIQLIDLARDVDRLAFTRIGDGVRHGIFERRKATESEPEALRLFMPLSRDRSLDDYTMSLGIKAVLGERARDLAAHESLNLKARAGSEGQIVFVTLVEADGTSWATPVKLSTNWQTHVISLSSLQVARGVKLPLGFPERWNYWLTPAKGRGSPGDTVQLRAVEHIQFSLRPSRRTSRAQQDPWIDLASLELLAKSNALSPPLGPLGEDYSK